MKLFAAFALLSSGLIAADGKLSIYHIDVEGGAATLIVTPAGESLLVDTGNPRPDDRDAKRIHEVATKHAGLQKLDYVWITHFHGDHVGGLQSLVKMMPVGAYYDHGDSVEQNAGWTAYQKLVEGKRTSVKPGEKLPLKGVTLQVAAAHGNRLSKAINGGGANAFCKDAKLKQPDPTDNAQSAGFLLTFGKFQFLDLGDLTWNKEHDLACPQNLVGKVDVYQVTHHGLDQSSAPQLVWAVQPQVAIMNNGPRKGGATSVFEILKKSPGIQDVWQLHWSEVAEKRFNSEEPLIANMTPTAECKGNWIKVVVEKNGKYTVSNSRNNFSKTYSSR